MLTPRPTTSRPYELYETVNVGYISVIGKSRRVNSCHTCVSHHTQVRTNLATMRLRGVRNITVVSPAVAARRVLDLV